MKFRKEVTPFVLIALALYGVILLAGILLKWMDLKAFGITTAVFTVLIGYFFYFFCDLEWVDENPDPLAIIAGADGVLACIKEVEEPRHIKGPALRVSIFLSAFNVHVNRAPIAGKVRFLQYYPGKCLFAFTEKSSDV